MLLYPIETSQLICRANQWTGFYKIKRPVTLLKKRLRDKCFAVNFLKFSRTPLSESTSRRLLLPLIKTYLLIASSISFKGMSSLQGWRKLVVKVASIISLKFFSNNQCLQRFLFPWIGFRFYFSKWHINIYDFKCNLFINIKQFKTIKSLLKIVIDRWFFF